MSRKYQIERPQSHDVEEIVQFLLENFVTAEVILASLEMQKQEEITIMLTDLVRDCIQCSSTSVIRNPANQKIDGVCLASKASLFDMQIDRLCEYQFTEEQVATAVEFLKYVFNRLDITYHFEEQKVFKPVFVAVVSVRKEKWGQGIASAMLDACMAAARDDHCDGAIALASNHRACQLIQKRFPITIQSIRYDTFRGSHRSPPIVMPKDEPQRALYVMLTRFQ
ncbi:unnamed protein product [Caenorhabditis bovis]|uniref:N-acetyltransferase domain-containing protein n=1 Tax=Caenorhabditis bovis TaxID=2654633 RepID=A0A8S1F5A2_9PELO|nr:unnamed protein product [Caenorhabditis bovis]